MATASSFKIQCPSCEAQIPIRDPGLVGKKISCPKCKFGIVVAAPDAAPVKSGKAGAAKGRRPVDDDDDDNDGFKKKSKKPQKKGVSPVVWIGAGVGLLAIVGIIVATTMVGGDDSSSSGGGGSQVNNGGNSGSTAPNTAPNTGPNDDPKEPPVVVAPRSVSKYETTNLLPNDSASVIHVSGPDFLRTPVGNTIFDQRAGAGPLFKAKMGFPTEDVESVVVASGEKNAWIFAVIRLAKPITLNVMQDAMTLGPVKNIKRRDMYPIVDNEMLSMAGEYLKAEFLTPDSYKPMDGNPPLALTMLDNVTVVIAHQPVLEKFLTDDAKPKFLSVLSAPPAAPATPAPGGTPGMMPGMMPMGTSPMGTSPSTGAAAPKPKADAPAGDQPVYTTVPTFLTIDPALKAVLNMLEEGRRPVAAAVVRSPRVGAMVKLGFLLQGKVFPSVLKMPDSPTLGVGVYHLSTKRLQASMISDFGTAESAESIETALRTVAPFLAEDLTKRLGTSVVYREGGFDSDPNNPMSPMFPGMPTMPGFPSPGPMGTGGGRSSGPSSGPRSSSPSSGPRSSSPSSGPGIIKSANSEDPGFIRGFQSSSPGSGRGSSPGSGGARPGSSPSLPGGMPKMPGMPGSPGGFPPPSENPEEIGSNLSVERNGELVLLSIDVDWSRSYGPTVSDPLRQYLQTQRARAVLLSGRANWFRLGVIAQKAKEQGTFPAGTLKRQGGGDGFARSIPPDQKMSFFVDLLPSLGHEPVLGRMKLNLPWNDPVNLTAGEAVIPEFLSPVSPKSTWQAAVPSLNGKKLGATNFVGLSGIGLDAGDYPDDPAHAKKLGIIGYDRRAKFEEVEAGDGLGNTILLVQCADDIPRPWIRGGGATVMGVPETQSAKRFMVLMPDGKFATYALMADGSARLITANVSDDVFKALTTYKGGEKFEAKETMTPLNVKLQGGAK